MHPRERIAYSAINDRKPLKLPGGLRLIMWPVLALEEWDMSRPMARMVITPPQGQPMIPDHPNWSWHEYGMRVGFWRIKRMLDDLKINPTVTLNARVCETYPVGRPSLCRRGLGIERVLLRGRAIPAPVKHLVLARDAFAQSDAEVADLGCDFLKRTTSVLPQASEVTAAPGGFDEWREAFRIVQAKEVWETFGGFITRAKPKLGPGIRERMEFAATITAD
jgi:hypothetical protein